jgi:Uma2 family endonuclease
MIASPTPLLTFEEFVQLDLDDNCLYELIGGHPVPMAEPSGAHESLRSLLLLEFGLEIRRLGVNLEAHPKTLCKLSKNDGRRPDLLVVRKDVWKRQTQIEATLRDEAPALVVEIVSTNWEDDYINKPRWYAAFAGGVPEYWILDPMFTIDRYPKRKHPEIAVPTLSIGTLTTTGKLLEPTTYSWQRFTGSDQIASQIFPDFPLTLEQILASVQA